MNKALILIPGIKGTKIHDSNTIDNEILWQDFRYNFSDFERTELTFEKNGKYYDEDFSTIAKPLHVEPLAYREFFKKVAPMYEHKFVFPYDWRLPNKLNAEHLKEFMDYIIEKSSALDSVSTISQFDFVTHSMGNMPLRYYIKEHGMTHVNKIAFVAPPFLGGAEAISALCVGQGMFFNQDEVRKLARSLPALFELLPTYKHFAINSKTGADVNLWNKNNWQSNLITEGGDPVKNKSIKKFVANLKSAKTALDGVENWHEGLTDQEKERILVLVKTEMKTMMDVVVEKNPTDGNPANFIDFNKSLFSEEGDGIVPNASSCCYFDQFATYCFQNRLIQDDFKHPFFLKDNRVQNFINSFFNSNLGTGTFKLDLIGRTVHKVKNLAVETIEHKGVNHKLTKIVV